MVASWIWVLIPIAGIMVAIVAILSEHRQKMVLIEKGMKWEDLNPPPQPEATLKGGIIVFFIGIAFLLAQLIGRLTAWLLLPGFILLFIGIALVVVYVVIEKKK